MVSKLSKNIITQSELKTIFTYDSSGVLIKKSNNKSWGCKSGSGYLHGIVNGTYYYVHQLVYLYHYGMIPKCIDHLNRNKLDNKIENLRDVTLSQNSRNTCLKGTASSYRGVSWQKNRNKRQARIRVGSARIWLGYYDNEIDAANAYETAAIKYGIKEWTD